MNGLSSDNSFFKKFPKMYVCTFQGSLNSTSEGVQGIFKKAKEILEAKNKEIISTIYFDEIGLAEHSPHNPLKVLHSELEYDDDNDKDKDKDNSKQNKKKVSFVGVSNWNLDSSKMNRGITISIQEPNEEDIKNTSIIIACSYLGIMEKNLESFFQNLGSCYYKYIQEFKKKYEIKKYNDFHGNRDFYHLIKYCSTKINEARSKKQEIEDKFLSDLKIKGIGRNFGGLIIEEYKYGNGLQLMYSKVLELESKDGIKNLIVKLIRNNEINIKDKIIENLTESTKEYLSRYLLLIAKSNIGIYLLSFFLESIKKLDYNIFIGSIFEDDIRKEEYSTKILSKIKMNMEKETILILKDMDSIYPSLYDLFNQNFKEINTKKYARIALGAKTNSFSEVNNNFRCIIIVDEDKLARQEIPFLNRFEKQNMSFEYLMTENQRNIANKLYEKCQNMIKYDKSKIGIIDYDLSNLLINCNKEEINGIVFIESQKITQDNDKEEEYYEDKLISKISLTLPQDIILCILNNEENSEFSQFNKKILDNYNKNAHNNIKSYLNNYKGENNKIVIYTFTRIIDPINKDYLSSINIKETSIELNNIKEIRITSILNEFNLQTEIDDFLENNNYKICFIKLLPNKYSMIDYLKVIIENKEKEYQMKKDKYFIFLVHLNRKNENNSENINSRKILTNSLSNLSRYSQAFIDDINGHNNNITLKEMKEMKVDELYKTFINVETIFSDNIYYSFGFFDYAFNPCVQNLTKDKYIIDLIELFKKDEDLRNVLNNLIIKLLTDKKSNENLIEKIIKEEKFTRGDVCIFDIIKKVVIENYINEFKIIYRELENNYYFSNLINNRKNYIDIINRENKTGEFDKKIKEIFAENIDIKNKVPEDEVKFDINLWYNLPSKNIIENLYNYIIDNITNQYKEIENQFKYSYYEDSKSMEDAKKQYEDNKLLLKEKTKEYLIKNEIIKKVESINGEEKSIFYKLLLDDFLYFLIFKYIKEEKDHSIINIKSFIYIVLSILPKEEIDLNNLAVQLNWLVTYINEIIEIVKLFSFLNQYPKIDCVNDKIKNNIPELTEELKKYIPEITEEFKKNYKTNGFGENMILVNEIFYVIIGSLIKIFIINLTNIISEIKDQDKFNQLLYNLNNMYFSLLSINNNLSLYSKEIYLFHQTINVISILSFCKNDSDIEKDKSMILEFINKKIIKDQKSEKKVNIHLNLKKENNNDEKNEKTIEENEEEKKLKENLESYYNYYHKKNNIDFTKTFTEVLYDEYNKEFNENYRKHIIETILKDEELIPRNILLIKKIITDDYNYIKPEKEVIDNALDYISSEETFFPLFNNDNRKIVEKTIMKIFDSIIYLYYDSLEKPEQLIISELFKIFKEYITVLTNVNYQKYYKKYVNDNLIKLYALCFIRIYLQKFTYCFCDKRNELEGEENKIIDLICKEENTISNTLQIYFIILLYNKKKSLTSLENDIKNDTTLEKIFIFYEKINDENFQKNLEQLKIPEKKDYSFREYFSYVEYPSFNDFKTNYDSKKDNQEIYPLLAQYIKNEQEPKNLKHLYDYNDFVNLMINYYSGNISRYEAKERNLNNFEDNVNIQKKLNKFKEIYNNCLSKELKKDEALQKDKFIEKINGYEKIAYYLNDDDETDYGIFILKGLKLFIKWQNSFLKPIIEAYKSKKNNILKYYIYKMEKSVKIYEINKSQILQIENCFEKQDFICFNELFYIYSQRDKVNINKFIYDFENIEKELAKYLLPNKCLIDENNFKYVVYKYEGFKLINHDFFIKFGELYGEEEPTKEDKKNIFIYAKNKCDGFDNFFNSFILLVNYLNNNYCSEKETKIIDLINEAKKKYINIDNNFFINGGKGIPLNRLLKSFLYMEHLYFSFSDIKDNLKDEYKTQLNQEQKDKIKKYFTFMHKDEIITKKEIAAAVRRFIMRYLLKDNNKKIVHNLKLYQCLERKYLWDNRIFSIIEKEKKDFNILIKEYIGQFSFLEVGHCFEFYNIIGEEDKKFILQEKEENTFNETDNEIQNRNNKSNPQQQASSNKGRGRKVIIGGKFK